MYKISLRIAFIFNKVIVYCFLLFFVDWTIKYYIVIHKVVKLKNIVIIPTSLQALCYRKHLDSPQLVLVSDKNECDANECNNGATCQDDLYNYSCRCRNGYTGKMCETCQYFDLFTYFHLQFDLITYFHLYFGLVAYFHLQFGLVNCFHLQFGLITYFHLYFGLVTYFLPVLLTKYVLRIVLIISILVKINSLLLDHHQYQNYNYRITCFQLILSLIHI